MANGDWISGNENHSLAFSFDKRTEVVYPTSMLFKTIQYAY